MICERCNQNYATTIVTKTVNGKTSTVHMCQECAFKVGYSNLFGNFSLNHIMSDFDKMNAEKSIRCSNCGSTFDELLATGRIGCSNCYSTFSNELMPTIENIHGKAFHVGKRPKSFTHERTPQQGGQSLLEELKQRLDHAIAEQEFETAAVLRDEIKRLDDQKKDGGEQK